MHMYGSDRCLYVVQFALVVRQRVKDEEHLTNDHNLPACARPGHHMWHGARTVSNLRSAT